MACGCSDGCACVVADTDTVSWTGDGDADTPFQATVIPDPAGGLQDTADGVAILLDPASTAPVSVGVDGLRVDCCPACVSDTDTLGLTVDEDGCISGDVVLDPDGALESTAAGVRIKIDPASTANVTETAAGLRVDTDAAVIESAAWDVGDLKPTTRTTPSSPKWLMCDGSFVAQASYPQLFVEIGHEYNAGVDPGDGTFKLPDSLGRTMYGTGAHADVNSRQDNDGLANASRTPKHLHSDGTLAADSAATGLTVDNLVGRTADATDQITGATNINIQEAAGADFTPAGGVNLTKAHHDHVMSHGHTVTDPTHAHTVSGDTGTSPVPYFVGNWMIRAVA